jgi:hypothetical protein
MKLSTTFILFLGISLMSAAPADGIELDLIELSLPRHGTMFYHVLNANSAIFDF